MKLEMANFIVKDVRFNGRTSYKDEVLTINKEELSKLVLEDTKIESAEIDISFPGDKTRIVLVRDVIEPRIKVSGPGCVFPGIMGPVEAVGEGRTHRLSGVTVIAAGTYLPTIITGTGAARTGLVDMWKPGSQATPFGATINITLIFKLRDGVTELEAHSAIQLAMFKIGHRLAKTTIDKTPQNVEVFELTEVDPSLPRIIYNMCLYAETETPRSVAIYGLPIRESLPTYIHPNEFLDGAITSDARAGSAGTPEAWEYMNNPVILGLFREHGKSLNFLGVILQRTRFETQVGKQVTAARTSEMARFLKADGAVFTRISPSGNNFMDVMFTLQAYERKGIKTALITPEDQGSSSVLVDVKDRVVSHPGVEYPLPFYVPEATAIVSTGDIGGKIKLPAPTKVLGCKRGELVTILPKEKPMDPWKEITARTRREITSGIDWFGCMNFVSVDY